LLVPAENQGMELESVNPATLERVASYPTMSEEDLVRAVAQASHAQAEWAIMAPEARAQVLLAAAERLLTKKHELARTAALEMGKPVTQGESEVEKCASVCRYYAREGPAFLERQTIATEAKSSFVEFRPLGTVLAVMPWNFPYWQVFRFAAPALMAGNAALLKHAANVTGCAVAIEEVWREAGLPEGMFRTLRVGHDQVARLIADPRVAAVTLTGSTDAGREVAAHAGAALKKMVLELGGSDAYVVLEDADVAEAAATCAAARLINAGQSCIAAKRFIVVEAVRERFESAFVAAMRVATVGDPLDPATSMGPLARVDLRDALHDQVQRSVRAGARLELGGEVPAGVGAFYPATVLTGVLPGMAAFDEETFGPVAAIVPAADESAAVRLANQSSFGLGAAVFTRDLARGERIATFELDAGSCFVNEFVRSDPRLPFGGVRESGFGRELGSFGIREFVNVKTIYVK
jgi:succinate-semialdehyde dehydrogenase/glutarate-semialdehyde dehydrogenase